MKLSETSVLKDPLLQFARWFGEASKVVPQEVNAMCLCTAGRSGKPSSRMVLLKEVDGSGFVFYTNCRSRKGREMEENSSVAATFHWKEMERQVRITGRVKKLPRSQAVAYFNSRPIESRISAAISPQSEVIPGRLFLENRKAEVELALKTGMTVSCPPDWTGYRIVPAEIEFWQGREHRLHDRILYTKKRKEWIIRRLAP